MAYLQWLCAGILRGFVVLQVQCPLELPTTVRLPSRTPAPKQDMVGPPVSTAMRHMLHVYLAGSGMQMSQYSIPCVQLMICI